MSTTDASVTGILNFMPTYPSDATVGKFVINDIEEFVACQWDSWIIEFLSYMLAHELWGECEVC